MHVVSNSENLQELKEMMGGGVQSQGRPFMPVTCLHEEIVKSPEHAVHLVCTVCSSGDKFLIQPPHI